MIRILLLLPGIALAITLALIVARGHEAVFGSLLPTLAPPFSIVLAGLFLGILLGPFPAIRERLAPGLSWSSGDLLKVAIVLLGARTSLGEVLAVGGPALLVVALLMVLSLAVSRGLGRLLGVEDRLSTLIGVGTAVCGNSAIMATAPAIHAREEEVGYAVATNTLFGTLAVLSYPLLGHALGMEAGDYGFWAGLAVNDTAQAVAAGFALGEVAGQRATVVKLARNAMMGLALIGATRLHGEKSKGALRKSFPPFLVGFLIMAALRGFGILDFLHPSLDEVLGRISGFFLLVALAALGLGTRLEKLRALGLRPLILGLASATVVGAVALLLVQLGVG